MIKKKILFLVRLPPPMHGAAKMNDLYLNSKLINSNFCIKYIKLNNYSSLKQNIISKALSLLGMINIIFKLISTLVFWRPDLIYFEIAPRGYAFLRDSIYIWICKLFSKKIICQLQARGIALEVNKKWKRDYYKLVFKNIKVIMLSKQLYSDVQKVISRNNVFYLPNGIENEISDREFNSIITKRKKNKKSVLLFFSNMIESKGPLDVLEVCKLLKKDKTDFECLFAGAWDSYEFRDKWYETVKRYELEDQCKYLGPKYGKEKNKLFENANYLIFPTKYPMECYPLVIMEAFMYGVSVLSYDTGAIKEIINKDELGFVSKNNNYQDIYKYLKSNIYKQSNEIKIRNQFKERHTFDKAEQKMVIIFKNVIK